MEELFRHGKNISKKLNDYEEVKKMYANNINNFNILKPGLNL